MLNFAFSEKSLGIVSQACYILLTKLISISDCLYFLRHGAICVLQLFASLVVTINLVFLYLSHFLHDQKFKTKMQIFWELKELLR